MDHIPQQMNPPFTSNNRFTKALCRWELAIVIFIAWLVFISIPITLGQIGLSWDGLNHHIYLGWVADQHRFGRDYMAAGQQAYQFPYLYWPVYKLAMAGVSGVTAGVVLATMHLITVPPVWIAAKALIPENTCFGLSLRLFSVTLAFMSAITLKTFETTGNDLLAAAPLIWAIALTLKHLADDSTSSQKNVLRTSIITGLLAGISTALKMSNGPLAALLPLVFLAFKGATKEKLKWALINTLSQISGFLIIYGYWGYHLWLQFGNPMYPFMANQFAFIQTLMGWQP